MSTLVKRSCSVVPAFLAMANAACLGPPCSPAAKSAATDAPGLSAATSSTGGAVSSSRLSATRCRAPSRSPVLAHELAQDLQKPAFRALTTCVVLFDADQSDVRGGNMPMLKTKSAMTMTAERPPRRGASRPTARSRRPRSSAARTATRCAGRPRAAALLAARPRAHRPPARPLQGRVRPLAHGAHGPRSSPTSHCPSCTQPMSTVLLSARRWTQCLSAMSCCFQMMGPSCELWVVW